MSQKGPLVVLSGPSGVGKGTILKKVREIEPNIPVLISYTTRERGEKEVHGVDYFFVSLEEFNKMKDKGEFAEFALVHGNYYGTSRAQVDEKRNQGIPVVLEIDCQGAFQIKESDSGTHLVFVLPPSRFDLVNRIRRRNRDSDEAILRRVHNAKGEIERAMSFDSWFVNRDLQDSTQQFLHLLRDLGRGMTPDPVRYRNVEELEAVRSSF